MPLREGVVKMISEPAARIIDTSLDAITPRMDLHPRKAEAIRASAESIICDAIREHARKAQAIGDGAEAVISDTTTEQAGDMGVLTNPLLSDVLRGEAESVVDSEVANVLNGIAQSLACLGDPYRRDLPYAAAALKPMPKPDKRIILPNLV